MNRMSRTGRYLDRMGRTLRYYLRGLYERLDSHHVFLLSGGMAFSLLICTLPLILILFAALGAIIERPAITSEIMAVVERLVPYPETAAFIKEFIINRVREFASYRSLAGVIGSVGLLFAATGLFSSMRTLLGLAFRSQSGESVLRGKLRDLGFVVFVLVFFLLSITVLPGLGVLEDFADKFEFLQQFRLVGLDNVLLDLISLVLIWIGFLVVYFAVPYERAPLKAILVASVWAAVFWKGAEIGFGFYLSHYLTFKKVWGPYALLVAAAFWSYYTSIVFVIGAEIGQLYRERHDPLLPSAVRDDSPSQFFRD